METIRYTERRKATKKPAIFLMLFLILGGAFVAYAIKFEDNPRMLGFTNVVTVAETNSLEDTGMSTEEKINQAMSLNYEIKDVSSIDKSKANFVSDIHLPTIYVDGKEITDINVKIQDEYTTRFNTLKESMKDAESNYSFNVTYTFHDNLVGTKKVVSLVLKQQIIDTDSQKVTSEKVSSYNVDLSSKTILSQNDVLVDLLGKDAKTILKGQVKEYLVNNKYTTESNFNYEITGLENFYIENGNLHIVFNESDKVVDSKDVIDIVIEKE